ncbi:MAG: ornithine carbamoyltransferase [Armatimonadetes bacterium]|nr:ornithine carbamoyltransferase [Armatimonadota bacterium]
MWQRFTEKARLAIFYAQEEAAKRKSRIVGTEHLLLGLLHKPDNIAKRVFQRIGVNEESLRREIEKMAPVSDTGDVNQDMQLSANAKRAIDLAYQSARELRSNYVGTEHLLLGLVKNDRGTVAPLLAQMGVTFERVKQEISAIQTSETRVDEITAHDSHLKVPDNMRGKDLISIDDLSREEIETIFDLARQLKSRSLTEQYANPILPGKTLAMIFEKPSLRTRVTFEVGMSQLGGNAVYLAPADIRMGEREQVSDVAKNLERWVHGIMARTFKHKTITELAKYANIPIINGLSDLEHPCQALADFLTILEKKGDLSKLKLAYIGDGCNTCHSLMLLAAKVGTDIAVGCPEGYEPNTVILNKALRAAEHSEASIKVTNDPFEAVENADAIYTDVWCSMGLEDEREKRLPVFQPYQVNQKLVEAARNDVIVLHCLPAHRGEEITDEVIDGPHSVVFDEAENRLHVQKALLALLL